MKAGQLGRLFSTGAFGGLVRVGGDPVCMSPSMRLKFGSQCLYFGRDARTNQSRHWISVTNASGFGTAQIAGVRIRNMSINTTSRRTVPKEVVVIGAGPTGMVTALLLASQGHKVTVLERKREYGAGPGSIQIPVNGSSLLVKWGLEEVFRTVASKKRLMHMQRYDSLETLYTTVTEPGSAYVSMASDRSHSRLTICIDAG